MGYKSMFVYHINQSYNLKYSNQWLTFDFFGYTRNGYTKNGTQGRGTQGMGPTREGYTRNGAHKEGVHKEGVHKEWDTRDGYKGWVHKE